MTTETTRKTYTAMEGDMSYRGGRWESVKRAFRNVKAEVKDAPTPDNTNK